MSLHQRFFSVFLALALGLLLIDAAFAQGQGKNRLKAEFDEELTPLQSAIRDVVEDRKGKGKDHPSLTLKCANPKSNNPRCQQLEETCRDCGNIRDARGRVVGKKNRSETIIDYAHPGQRKNGADKFDRIKLGSRKSDGFGAGPGKSWKGLERPDNRPDLDDFSDSELAASVLGEPGASNAVAAKLRQGRFGLAEPVNNDKDCIDSVTREWFPEAGCFENDVLITNLLEIFDEDENGALVGAGCEHVMSGEVFAEDPLDGNEGVCYFADGTFRGTSLEELIDEDGPDFAASIDQDGDGRFDEDPSESGDATATCAAFYAQEGLTFDASNDLVDGECDLSRAFMVRVNREFKNNPDNTTGELAFLVDEDGWPVDEATARNDKRYAKARTYGEHPRRVRLAEEFAIKCKGNEELIDGECVGLLNNNAVARKALAKARADGLASLDRTQTSPMLMGFTFAPPVVEWGYTIDEEVCVNLLVGTVCAEVFFARIGYEFDVAAGLRLPVNVELSALPPTSAPGILAESTPVIRTSLEPKDFSVGEFRQICLDNNLSNDCTRFAFPEFIDSFNPFKSADEKDGSELVARETIFAGIQVRTLGIPLINWAVDSDVDLMAMCSMIQIRDAVSSSTLLDMAKLGLGVLSEGDTSVLLDKISSANCATFETPFGFDENGDLRTFPFTKGIDVRADCAEALVRGEVITIKGKPRPICTGLVLGTNGASLGVGLGVEASLGSTRIDAKWSPGGDSIAASSNRNLIYRHNPGSTEADVIEIPLRADNYQDGVFNDTAQVSLDDFVYYLNTVNLALNAKLQFGGILSPIPDIASFTLFNLVISGDSIGIPIGQHAGMDPIRASFFVRNYAATVDGAPGAADPDTVDFDTLLIKPGDTGAYEVRVTNRGSVTGDFDNLRYTLSNERDQALPYRYVINPNTDFDCISTDGAATHYRGYPYDGIADDCYTPQGTVRGDRQELIDEDGLGPEGQLAAVRDEDGDGLADEDPVDNWQAAFEGPGVIAGVGAYQESSDFRRLLVTPFRHPLTAPGIYPVQILADSVEAKSNGLQPVDPVGQTRVNAEDTVLIQVDAFYDPLIAAQPASESGKPGVGKAYTVEVSNGSNVDDTIDVDTRFVDYNQVGCTLTTLGTAAGCPFRAVPTAVQLAWTNGKISTPAGPLAPLGLVSQNLTIDVPSDWAGMEDTTYQVVFTVTSQGDPESPPASNRRFIEQTVVATMESMTRYIGLELDELIAVLDQANADGVATAGLKPISMQAVQRANNRALASILDGNLRGASRTHAANIRVMEGFVRALNGSGKSLPADLFMDLQARAAAIIGDLEVAEASQIPSA